MMPIVRLPRNRRTWLRQTNVFFAAGLLCLTVRGQASAQATTSGPEAVPTFECVGLYWKPAGAAADNACSVSYRARGEANWHEAMPLWFDPTEHPRLPEHSLEYRGSVVNLQPDTAYEIKLHLEKQGTDTLVNVKTWNDKFPVSKTVTIPADAPQPFVIGEGGSQEGGYVVYTAAPGTVFDGGGKAQANVQIKAPFVILRGLTLKNAAVNGVELGDVQDVVIEGCDISGWGRIAADGYGENLDSALYAKSGKLERIVVQDCKLHNPRSNSNSWTESRMHEGKETKHPIGPQGISFVLGKGRYVIRRNRVYSDPDHKYNDSMGELANFSYAGFPNRDSDIYANEISQTYDDGIELEGADMNVRAWGNHFDDVYGALGDATVSLGPMYVWRNVLESTRKGPKTDADSNKGSYLVKLGTEEVMYTKGKLYVFHNTMIQTPPRFGLPETTGGGSGIVRTGDTKFQSNVTSRNNILFIRDTRRPSINDPMKDTTNDYDYDLYNGKIIAAEGNEAHGIVGVPKYEPGKPGVYPLAADSPGIDAGVRLPNFNDDFKGKGPDIGAFESK